MDLFCHSGEGRNLDRKNTTIPIISLTILILLFIIVTFTRVGFTASFSCDEAATTVEKLICSNAKLSQLDEELAIEYREILKKLPQRKKSLNKSQREWLRMRNKCANEQCITDVYESRLCYLKMLAYAEKVGDMPEADNIADTENSQLRRCEGKKLNSAENLEIQQIKFSTTEYISERNAFIEHRKNEKSMLKKGKLYVALEDLNDDGINEMFVYIHDYYYCGRETGCPLHIYKIQSQTISPLLDSFFEKYGFPIFMNINDKGEQKDICILSNKTKGWHDLFIQGEIWQWNGTYYKYSKQI